nr:MAG TPA: Peroxide operon regulator stress regulator, DNA binding.75A [Caudoviricetes sp.]
MQAKKCDRCGKLYELYNTESNGKKCNGFLLLNIDADQKYYAQNMYDMCPECMEALMKWLYAIKNGMKK